MNWLMKLAGLPDGKPTPYDGEYLEAMDFEANGGRGVLCTTPDKTKAKKFKSMKEALSFYRTSPMNKLLRGDNRPNRPLTASNWEFVKEEEA